MSFPEESGFFYGVDLSFDGETPPRTIAQFPPTDPGPVPPLVNALRAIPTQSFGTIRVLVENFAESGTMIGLFKPLSLPWLINEYTSTSLAEIIAQCHGNNEDGAAWGFSMTSFHRTVANSKFGPDVTMKRWLPRARIFKDESERITLFISCKASMKTMWQHDWTEATKYSHDVLLEFVHTMESLDRQYKAMARGILLRLENQSMLLALRLLHSQVLMQCRAMDAFQELYDSYLAEFASHTQATVGASVVTTQTLEKIATISNQADRLHDEVKSVATVADSLLDMLSPLFRDSNSFGRLEKELRAMSKILISSTEDLVPRLETKLRFLETNRNIRESTSLWLITLFAAIFLPFSLASSLLSMQTRLADLHFLLYDFCGVIVFFGSLALVVVFAMKQFAKRKGNVHGIVKMNKGANLVAVLLGWFALVLSFLVGMTVDVGLGLKILYLGVAAFVGMLLLSFLLRSMYWHSPSVKRLLDNSRDSLLLFWTDLFPS